MKIGVNGASGQLGAATVRALLARVAAAGSLHQVVAISRSVDKAAQAGVEARFGNYDDPASLASAYRGLDRLLLIPSMDLAPGARGVQLSAAIDAAVAAGVNHIVLMSSAGAYRAAAPNIAADYFVSEQHLMRVAPHWSVLRMNYYAESFVGEAQKGLGFGVITGLAESRVGFVSRLDLAAAAAGLLLGEGHDGAIYTGTGPAAVSGAERAALVARLGGKPVAFVVQPEETLRGMLAQAGLPPAVIDAVTSIQKNFASGAFDIVTGDVKKLSGQAPQPLEAVLAAALRA